jgi:hypothetical protein
VLTRVAARTGVEYGSPTAHLPRFDVQRFWDADSTPPALACLSRGLGQLLPSSGARTPTIEAGVVMASLMHDVAYYYGGNSTDRDSADRLFGAQIPFFVGLLDKGAVAAAERTAAVDVMAVSAGGGFPFRESYSWSYGWEKRDRGYASLNPGEAERIQGVARETFKQVVGQIASGTFQLSDVLREKLSRADPQQKRGREGRGGRRWRRCSMDRGCRASESTAARRRQRRYADRRAMAARRRETLSSSAAICVRPSATTSGGALATKSALSKRR